MLSEFTGRARSAASIIFLTGASVAVALVAGCAAQPLPEPEPPPAVAAAVVLPTPVVISAPVVLPEVPVVTAVRPRNTAVDQALAFADSVRSLTGVELTSEIARLGDPGEVPLAQVQLALALLQTHLPPDTARALGLLQRAQASTDINARALQPLVRLLISRASDQRRLEETLDRQNQQLRDSQRRIDQLTDRLEAVRAIERSLTAPRAPGSTPPSNSRTP